MKSIFVISVQLLFTKSVLSQYIPNNAGILTNPGIMSNRGILQNSGGIIQNSGGIIQNPGGIIQNPGGIMQNPGGVLSNNPNPVLGNPGIVLGNPVIGNPGVNQPVKTSVTNNNINSMSNIGVVSSNGGGVSSNVGVSDLPVGAGLLGQANLPTIDCGKFVVTCSSPISPTGVSVIADNLVIDGALAVSGNMPIFSAVAVEGALPASGQGSVLYISNNGENDNVVEVVSNNEAVGVGTQTTVNSIGNFGNYGFGRS